MTSNNPKITTDKPKIVSTVLTWREARAFTFIRHYMDQHGYAPTVRDIAAAAGLSSPSSTAYVLSRLETKGYLHRLHGRQALAIEPAHAGQVLVRRDDLVQMIKLLGSDADVSDMNGPVGRLMKAAGI